MILKNKTNSTFLVIAFLMFLSTCFLQINAKKEQQGEVDWQTLLDEVVQGSKPTPPGAVLGILYPDGKREFFVNGYSRLVECPDFSLKMKAINKFRIGSMTKTFTSTVVLQLIQDPRNSLQLDDEIVIYLPPRYKKYFDFKGITIRQCLNHTSGLNDYASNLEFALASFKDPLKVYTPFELVGIGFKGGFKFPPGEGYLYSNTNYALLGVLIEYVTGCPLQEEITRRFINNPGLGFTLSHTFFPVKVPYFCTDPYSNGYVDFNHDNIIQPGEDVTSLSPTGPWAAGAMISNANDLLTWIKAIFDGTLLDKEYQAERFNFFCTKKKGGQCIAWQGLGVEKNITQFPILGITTLTGHSGAVNGFNGFFGKVEYVQNKKPRHVFAAILFNVGSAPPCKSKDKGNPNTENRGAR